MLLLLLPVMAAVVAAAMLAAEQLPTATCRRLNNAAAVRSVNAWRKQQEQRDKCCKCHSHPPAPAACCFHVLL